MQRNIPIDPEQIKNAIRLLEAKIALREAKVDALTQHGRAFRQLVERFVVSQTNTCALELTWWAQSHQQFEDAEKNVIAIELAELQSQLAINKFMLKDAEENRFAGLT